MEYLCRRLGNDQYLQFKCIEESCSSRVQAGGLEASANIVWRRFFYSGEAKEFIVTKEYSAAIFAFIGVVLVLALGFSLPPLVAREGQFALRTEDQNVAKEELAYCRSNVSDVNCKCFARKSAQILVQDQPDVRGFVYADRLDLARGQASHTC
jgi:hypothetical protein